MVFAESEPLGELVVTTVCLKPQARLMQGFLQRAGLEWKVQQAAAASRGEPSSTPLLDALSGRLTSKFLRDAVELLQNEDKWAALPLEIRSHKLLSLAFAMVSCAICGIRGRIHAQSDRYPLCTWGLLFLGICDKTAAKIARDPACMQDEFTTRFLQKWEGKLTSPECLAALLQIAQALDVDISQQECHRASIRRMLMSRAHTWSKTFTDTSASWVLSRLRKNQAEADALGTQRGSGGSTDVGGEARPAKRKRAPGRYRTFLNERLSNDPRMAHLDEQPTVLASAAEEIM